MTGETRVVARSMLAICLVYTAVAAQRLLAAEASLLITPAAPGQTAVMVVHLDSEGADVAGAEIEISFDSGLWLGVKANGRPDCLSLCDEYDAGIIGSRRSTNGGGGKGCGAGFTFLPGNCVAAGTCTGAKFLELALDNVDPLPDQADLFLCYVPIPRDTPPGAYEFGCTFARGADPSGSAVAVDCTGATLHIDCPGDCNHDGTVKIEEFVLGMNIALENAEPHECPALDHDVSGAVTVDELVSSRNNLLTGCGSPP